MQETRRRQTASCALRWSRPAWPPPRFRNRLDVFLYKHIIHGVARASAASDAFNAIGEPTRRAILEYLAPVEHSGGDVVDALDGPQPSLSTHPPLLQCARP